MKDGVIENTFAREEAQGSGAGYPSAPPPDIEKYLPFVEEFDVTDAQKIEFLQTLWSIMSAFVDLGWGVDSVQRILPAWREISMDSQGDELQITDQNITPEFNGEAAGERERKDGHE